MFVCILALGRSEVLVLSQSGRPCSVFPFFFISFHICSSHPILIPLLTRVPSVLVSHTCLGCPKLSGMQIAFFCVILRCHLCSVWLYHIFSALSHKRQDFRGRGIIEHEMCVLTFSTAFFKNVSHSEKDSAGIITNVHKTTCRIIHYCQILTFWHRSFTFDSNKSPT